jgi:carbamoyl-phosphate synthase/aspartate carbamoyltransferase/dihydroorotase
MVIRSAKERGMPVTCEVCPHHLFLTSADAAKLKGKRGEVRPSLLTLEDQQALWENMDIIDCFATDHGECSVFFVIFLCADKSCIITMKEGTFYGK